MELELSSHAEARELLLEAADGPRGGWRDDERRDGSALLQLSGTLFTHRLWKFKQQSSHFNPCRTKPNNISPQ